jgi:TolA-binding protein
MRNCVFSLLLTLLTSTASAACTPSSDPVPVEPPVQPLVIGKTPPMPIATTAETAAPPADDTPSSTSASTTLAIPARDPRLSRSLHRPRPLVLSEVQGLEALLAATQMTAPDRPMMIARIAETYSDLSRSGDATTAPLAHRQALKFYVLLTNDHPTYAKVDEAYYYAGLEHEMAGDLRNARAAYYNLIKNAPQSKLIPLAYFAFGEMFYAEAASDPSKDDLALQAYAEVLKYPPPRNVVYADAQRRVSEVKTRKNGGTLTRP